jgi:hypothetical protein
MAGLRLILEYRCCGVNHIPGDYGMHDHLQFMAGALGIYYLLTHMYSMCFKLRNSLVHYIWSNLICQ